MKAKVFWKEVELFSELHGYHIQQLTGGNATRAAITGITSWIELQDYLSLIGGNPVIFRIKDGQFPEVMLSGITSLINKETVAELLDGELVDRAFLSMQYAKIINMAAAQDLRALHHQVERMIQYQSALEANEESGADVVIVATKEGIAINFGIPDEASEVRLTDSKTGESNHYQVGILIEKNPDNEDN